MAHTDERIAAVDQQLMAAIEQKSTIKQEIAAQNQVVDATLKDIQDQEKKLSVLEAQKNNIEQESGKLTGEIDAITSEFTRVE